MRWALALPVAAGLIWMAERQVSATTLAAVTGAHGLLERDGAAVPVTLYAAGPGWTGPADVLDGYRVAFGAGLVIATGEAAPARCRFRFGRVACTGGWAFRFADAGSP